MDFGAQAPDAVVLREVPESAYRAVNLDGTVVLVALQTREIVSIVRQTAAAPGRGGQTHFRPLKWIPFERMVL